MQQQVFYTNAMRDDILTRDVASASYTLAFSSPYPCQAKTSADMGHWLGLLLSQMGTKTDPEELTYDYVNSERISSIVNAAKTSL